MKKNSILKYGRFLGFMAFFGMMMTSCLESGEETIVLEQGDGYGLLTGSWMVERSELYDLNTHKMHSDMPDDGDLKSVLTFSVNNTGGVVTADGESSTFEWNLKDGGQRLEIGDKSFYLTSLGKALMAIESPRTVNGSDYNHRFVLKKVATVSVPDNSEEEEPDEDDPDNEEPNNETPNTDIEDGGTMIVTSDAGGSFRNNGVTVNVPRGAVPYNASGNSGRVAFSISFNDDLPASLPSGTTLLPNGSIKIEPMNFTFNLPIDIRIPLNGSDPSEVSVYWYDASTGQWVLIPFTSINSDGTATISVLELGYFIVVKNPGNSSDVMTTGGVHINGCYFENGYTYYLTLTPKNVTGASANKIASTSNGQDLYMAGLAMGVYTVTIVRERIGGDPDSDLTTIWATLPDVEIVNGLIKGSGDYSTYRGWMEIALVEVHWVSGRPNNWGDATATYGTGKFQATLTWVNVNGDATDYDLHLSTPSGEVYWRDKRKGAFELDYDWLLSPGNAIENIYSVHDSFDPGTYTVRVHHFGGAPGKRLNCRIIVNGTVVKSVTGALDSGYADIYTFTIER